VLQNDWISFFAFNAKSVITLVLCTLVPGAHFHESSNLQGEKLVGRCILSREK